MIKAKDVHIVLIGYKKNIMQYHVNLNIIRDNFVQGKDYYITSVFAGDLNDIVSGMGENCFIKLPNRGYALGALDAINTGVEYAFNCDRDIVMYMTYDFLWFSENNLLKVLDDFFNSKKYFASNLDVNNLFNVDCVIFNRKEILNRSKGCGNLFPLVEENCYHREFLEISKQYQGSQLGFFNMEEFFFKSLCNLINHVDYPETIDCLEDNLKLDNCYREIILRDFCYSLNRTDSQLVRYCDNYKLSHSHNINDLIYYLKMFKLTKGNFIEMLLNQ